MKTIQHECPKCGNNLGNISEMRAYANIWWGMMHLPNKHFTALTCTRCYYTELYAVTEKEFEQQSLSWRH